MVVVSVNIGHGELVVLYCKARKLSNWLISVDLLACWSLYFIKQTL